MHALYRARVDAVFDQVLQDSTDAPLRADHADIGGLGWSDEPEACLVVFVATCDADDVCIWVDRVAV